VLYFTAPTFGCCGIAAPSVRGSLAPKFTLRLASRITASPFPIAVANGPTGVITCPRLASSCGTASGTRYSICKSQPSNVPFVNRAVSQKACFIGLLVPRASRLTAPGADEIARSPRWRV
jgi:hypothetical protein